MCASSSWKQKFTLSSYIPKAQLTGFTDGLVWGVGFEGKSRVNEDTFLATGGMKLLFLVMGKAEIDC